MSRSLRHEVGPECAACLDTGLVTSHDPSVFSDLTVTHACPFGCHLPDLAEAAAAETSIARCTVASLAAVQETQQ